MKGQDHGSAGSPFISIDETASRACSRGHAIKAKVKAPLPGCSVRLGSPAKAPELNPLENIRQFMRENWISNRVFTSYADILDHCCAAWNKLIDQPWTILSTGLRQWAHQ